MTDVDPRRCPLCGGPNACGMAEGASTCWCFTVDIPSDVRARIPEAALDITCVCQACAGKRPDTGVASEAVDTPLPADSTPRADS